jgi:hypothetical protein
MEDNLKISSSLSYLPKKVIAFLGDAMFCFGVIPCHKSITIVLDPDSLNQDPNPGSCVIRPTKVFYDNICEKCYEIFFKKRH